MKCFSDIVDSGLSENRGNSEPKSNKEQSVNLPYSQAQEPALSSSDTSPVFLIRSESIVTASQIMI